MILFCSPDYSLIKRVPNNSVNLLGLLKSPRGIYLLIPIPGYNKVLKPNCCNLRFQIFIQRKNVTPSFGPIAKLCSYTMVLLAPRIIFTPSNYASFATIGSCIALSAMHWSRLNYGFSFSYFLNSARPLFYYNCFLSGGQCSSRMQNLSGQAL